MPCHLLLGVVVTRNVPVSTTYIKVFQKILAAFSKWEAEALFWQSSEPFLFGVAVERPQGKNVDNT